MYKLLIIIFASLFNVGCATTWVTSNARDKTHDAEIYFSDVKKVAMSEREVMLNLSRQGRPIAVHKKVAGVYKICFDRNMEFFDKSGFYLDKNAEPGYLCKEDGQSGQFLTIQPIEGLRESFFIPELNIAVSGISDGAGISPTRSLCHCEKLKNIESVVKSSVYFNKYLFYLMLENGERLRFSAIPRHSSEDNQSTIFTYYEVMKATEDQFLNEKYKPRLARVIQLDSGGYLLVKLAGYRDYVFHSSELFFSRTERVSRLVFTKHRETIFEEKGNKFYYVFFPLAIPFDIVTIPFQVGYFAYMMTQVN